MALAGRGVQALEAYKQRREGDFEVGEEVTVKVGQIIRLGRVAKKEVVRGRLWVQGEFKDGGSFNSPIEKMCPIF